MAPQTRRMIFDPIVPAILFILGGIIILAGVALYTFQRLKPRPPDPVLVDQLEYERQAILKATVTKTPTTAPTPTGTPQPTITPTPTLTRMPYALEGLLFDEGVEMTFIFKLPDILIASKAIEVWRWNDETMNMGIFKPGDDTAITYEDQDERVVMLAHSGGSSMTLHDLQVWLEDRGRATSETANVRIMTELIGSEVDIAAEDFTYAFMTVIAAVRVPPDDAQDVSRHVVDLVPYLAKLYPANGFHRIIKESDVLVLMFCGKALSDETPVPGISKWNQSRFIIAMVSAWEDKWSDVMQ